ncbi:uncharacterized protein LOC115695445 [Cannabis sativa]|uniref:uncharacterized protein LOC115695445 n=1 Tax=Cannabis sativa TaxID=3483 RepID=UPI0029CAAA9F|nr:uncharacterized protein LOC115695445 [Cannabis sativa]
MGTEVMQEDGKELGKVVKSYCKEVDNSINMGINGIVENPKSREKAQEENYSSSAIEGRMLIIWKKVYARVIVIEETNQYVHCYVKLASHTKAFYATFVYGLNGLEERKLLWKGLANLRFPVKPWIILSDFNALLNYGERVGGKSVTKAKIEDFNVWLSLGQVDTMKRVGCYYTWSSNQGGHDRIYSRIDHAFMNEDWLDLFPNWMATFSWEVVSDHCAILVSLIVMVEIGVKPFEFFNYRCEHKDFKNVVLESWMGNVEFDHQRAKEKFQEANLKAQANPGIEKFIEEEKLAPDNFKRREENRITSYVDNQGNLIDNHPDVVEHFINHFRATWKVAAWLLAGLTAEIRAEVSNAIKEFFITGKIPTQFNETRIYLVPKVEIPVRAIDYRPIACFSTIYKCITKLISKRLAKVLPWKIVSSRCVIKTDLSKAYDTVDWGFVEDLLVGLNFPSKASRRLQVYFLISLSLRFILEVSSNDKAEILNMLQFGEGSFPLRYLEVSLRPTKWRREDCDAILKKIKMRPVTWSIIKEVERLCRDFLWGIKGEICKINLASWDKVCLPKAYGGLGFKSGPNWNRSILGKFIWAIMDKHDILWVKWINNIYMKGVEFWEYELKGDTYNGLIQLDADMFYKAVWCNVSLPKHRFVLCEEEESLHHLFFGCFVSKAVMNEVFDWVGYPAWPIEFNSWLCWITGKISGVITLI